MGRALIVSAGASSTSTSPHGWQSWVHPALRSFPVVPRPGARMLESDFELIVVNAPLPDEFGHELCSSAVEKTDAGVVLLAKAAAAEQLLTPMSEQGVLLLSQAVLQHAVPAGHPSGRGQPTTACSCSGRKTRGCRKRSHRYGWSAMQNAVWWSGSR